MTKWESLYFTELNAKTHAVCTIDGVGYGFSLVDPAAWIREAIDIFGATGNGTAVVVRKDPATNQYSIEHPVSGRILPLADVLLISLPPASVAPDASLAFINGVRRRLGEKPLNPAAAGWTNDDVIEEEKRLRRLGYS